MADILVDSNVILDVATEDVRWFGWSSRQLEELAERSILVINPIVHAEVSIGFARIEDLDAILPIDAITAPGLLHRRARRRPRHVAADERPTPLPHVLPTGAAHHPAGLRSKHDVVPVGTLA